MTAEAQAGRRNPEDLNALVREWVIRHLGKPGDLHRVHVRPLWDNHYRVNVLTGADAAFAVIAHSYFVRVDTNGNIVGSTPEITRRY
jgi:hypothetical protein